MSDEAQKPKKTRDIGLVIRDETRAIRSDVQALRPLLELLETPEDGETDDPIEEIKQLLEQIVLGQRHLMAAIEDNTSHLVALRQGRRLKSGGSDPATQ